MLAIVSIFYYYYYLNYVNITVAYLTDCSYLQFAFNTIPVSLCLASIRNRSETLQHGIGYKMMLSTQHS